MINLKEISSSDILPISSFRPIQIEIDHMRKNKTANEPYSFHPSRALVPSRREIEYHARIIIEIMDKLPKDILCLYRGLYAFGSLNMASDHHGSVSWRHGVVNEIKFGSEDGLIQEMKKMIERYDVYLVPFVNYTSNKSTWINWEDGYEANFLLKKSISKHRSRSLGTIGL